MFDGLRDFVLDMNFSLQGVAATVTPAGSGPIDTSVIWMSNTMLNEPSGSGFGRIESHRTLALRRDQVSSIPINSIIVAPERPGLTPTSWTVDGYMELRSDSHIVTVRPT